MFVKGKNPKQYHQASWFQILLVFQEYVSTLKVKEVYIFQTDRIQSRGGVGGEGREITGELVANVFWEWMLRFAKQYS